MILWLLPILFCIAGGALAVLDARRESRRPASKRRRARRRGRVDVLPPPDKAASRSTYRFPQ